jgi:adenosylhomocysteine nucleosidase
MDMCDKVAIVAALEREIKPLVRDWHVSVREHDGRRFRFFESDHLVAVCGGIGGPVARRACEAIITLYQPALVVSAGFAGALESNIEPGSGFTPRTVINAQDGSRTDTGVGSGTLVTVDFVATPEQKRNLAKSYGAQAADMEAAAVARGAQARNIPFCAVKAISDGVNFVLPPIDRYVRSDGQLETVMLVVHIVLRPWIWRSVIQLARQSARASVTLCKLLQHFGRVEDEKPTLHPTGATANH